MNFLMIIADKKKEMKSINPLFFRHINYFQPNGSHKIISNVCQSAIQLLCFVWILITYYYS